VDWRVERVAVISARHLSRETWESGCGNFDLGAATFGNEHGFFCRVQPPEEVPHAASDLRAVLQFFAGQPVEWLRFAEDGALVAGLGVLS
jgi:hypothetical protein